MELLSQANLFFAVAAPIALIVLINFLLQGSGERRPLFDGRRPGMAAPKPVESPAVELEAANDAQHQRAA